MAESAGTLSVVLTIIAIVGVALLAALMLTPVARAVALRVGVVTHPSPDRWSKRSTPRLGGVAIVLAAAVGLVMAASLIGGRWAARLPTGTPDPALGVIVSAVLVFAVGLADDIVGLRAQAKFLLQLLAGVVLVSFGAVLPVTPSYVANVVATLFWFLALTNAFNLLDGLDGVAAGVGALASFFLGLTFAQRGAWWHASVAWSLTGATLGFLRYNFHPASIFMGDAGSLFLGSVLAGLVASSPGVASASLVSVLFVPLAIVAVPLLDTTLVTVTRVLSGRPIAQGGLDHSTYRLIALGLTESQVALLLCGFAAAGGGVALGLMRLDHGLGLLLGSMFLVAMSLLAAYVGHMQIGARVDTSGMKPVTVLVRTLIYKRRLAEILLDAVLVTLAYYGAYRLKFDGALPPQYAQGFEATLGLVIGVRLLALGLFGAYRGAWEYAGIVDAYRIIGAVVLSAAVVVAWGEWRVPALADAHGLVYIDALLAMALLLGARVSHRSLEGFRRWLRLKGHRVLIYGADAGGELALRELTNHGELGLRPVCFVDDDPRRHGAEIHGVPIVAGFDSLAWVVARYRIDKIVIGTRQLAPEAMAVIQALAGSLGLDVAEVRFGVRWLPAAPPPRATVEPRPSVERPVEPVPGSNGDGRKVLTDLRVAG